MDFLYKKRHFVLFLITLLGFVLRFYRLDAAGLSEDETRKLTAVGEYLQGQFTANAEHPMLMKLLMTATISINNFLHSPLAVETALRLPNVLFGALTSLILYRFFREMFGFGVGLLTALLWAININAILINRVAKEDTLLVFFLWLAYYCFRKAKKTLETEVAKKQRYYGWTGIYFGLMMASKYFPHYFGLNFLYYHLLGPNEWNGKVKLSYLARLFILMGITFVIFNPLPFLPGSLSYMLQYAQEQKLTHHGYWMVGQLFRNEPSLPVNGTPAYFYLLALWVKTPVPLLIAFLVGTVAIFRRQDEPYFFLRFMLVIWLIPYSWFGAKWLRYMLSFMPIFCVISAIGITTIYAAIKTHVSDKFTNYRHLLQPAPKLATAALLIIPFFNLIDIMPFYSIYVSPLAGGEAYVGYYFPHDEFYDLGLREAIQFIANDAEQEAIIGNEAPSVIKYYQQVFGRADLQSQATSDQRFQLSDHPTYIILQEGRRYFENVKLLQYVEGNYLPVKEVKVRGATAAKIFKINAEESIQVKQQLSSTVNTDLVIQ
jgi:asparagine N-glycosylation enzyme membrane subunit Stt3